MRQKVVPYNAGESSSFSLRIFGDRFDTEENISASLGSAEISRTTRFNIKLSFLSSMFIFVSNIIGGSGCISLSCEDGEVAPAANADL